MIGRVVSIKMKNTVVVLVEGTKMHPLYKKAFLRSKRYLVDDLLGVKPGDIVELIKIRPLSKMKHYRVGKVVGRDIEEIVEEELKEKAAAVVAEVMPEKPEESDTSDEIGTSEDKQSLPSEDGRKTGEPDESEVKEEKPKRVKQSLRSKDLKKEKK